MSCVAQTSQRDTVASGSPSAGLCRTSTCSGDMAPTAEDTKSLTPGPPDTAATLTPGHTTQNDVEDGDYALASKFYNTEIQATQCADAPKLHKRSCGGQLQDAAHRYCDHAVNHVRCLLCRFPERGMPARVTQQVPAAVRTAAAAL